MDVTIIFTVIIEAIGAVTGGLYAYRAYPSDIITAILMAVFALCCMLLGSKEWIKK